MKRRIVSLLLVFVLCLGMVACEGGTGLVGRVAVAGRSQGQNLPHGLACLLQKINKSEGLFAHGTDAVRSREAGNMHQNTAASHKRILLFSVIGISAKQDWLFFPILASF